MKMSAKQIICLALAVLIGLGSVPAVPAQAASKDKITIAAFVKKLEKAAGKTGLLKEGEYSNLKANIKREDAAVLTNRADEMLNGEAYSKELYSQVVDKKRVTGLKNVSREKKEAIRKCFVKGLMQGYSNGKCSQDRSFKPEQYLTAGEADKIVERLKDKKKRVKLSPDGQVIRTTNLPKNYKKFDYILASFPNEFYEKKFVYQKTKYFYKPVYLEDYASPKDVKKVVYNTGYEKVKFKKMYEQYSEYWLKTIKTNLECRLNFDYRKVNNKWVDKLRNTYYIYSDAALNKKETDKIRQYVNKAKKNKVIVKASDIVVEPSSFYMEGGGFYVRCYVKFKISSKDKFLSPETEAGAYKQGNLIYSTWGYHYLSKIKKGNWYEGYYDIEITGTAYGDDGRSFSIGGDGLYDEK